MATLLMAALPVGCLFEAVPPEDASLLCSGDGDCADGDVCDLAQHLCVRRGITRDPLVISEAFFAPPFAREGIVELHVRADRDIPAEHPPAVLFPEGRSLPLSPPRINGKDAVFFVSIDELPEGLYPVAAVNATNEAGAATVTDLVGVALVVDRTPPVLRNPALVDPPPGDVYADVAPFDTVVASALPSEPIAAASLHIGGIASGVEGCTIAEVVRCSLVIPPSSLSDGDTTVELRASDGAGNEGVVSFVARVDSAAPVVVEDSVTVSIETLGRASVVARADSRIVVTLVTDELLGAEPVLSLDVDGVLVPLTLVERAGRRLTFSFDGSLPGSPLLLPGTYGLRVSLVDVFGHAAADVPVLLPPPYRDGIPVEAGEVCPAPPGFSCVDIDGDDFAEIACGGTDENDFDDTAFPGMIEIPGDGVDNDFVSGDEPIVETSGVFVDSEAGDDLSSGTREAPLRSIDAAAALGTTLFLAERATVYGVTVVLPGRRLIGGLHPVSWSPTGGRSRVDNIRGARLVANLEATSLTAADTVVVRSRIATVSVPSGIDAVVMVDADVGRVALASDGLLSAGRSRIELLEQDTGGGARVVLRQSRASVVRLNRESHVVLVNSISDDVSCGTCRLLSIVHSVVTGTLDFGTSGTARVELVGAMILSSLPPAASFRTTGSTSFRVQGTNLFADGPGPVITIDAAGVSLEELNACSFVGCLESGGNLSERVAADGVPPADSPLRDRSVPLPPFTPAAVVRDIDGDCRYSDGASDIGADEGT